MQMVQRPHVFLTGASGSSARSVRIWPRNTHEPWPEVRTLVFLPNQPMPALSATARSCMGPVSTYTRA